MSLQNITAFNVGYGDCILLEFGHDSEAYFLLLDCGTLASPPNFSWANIASTILNRMNDSKVPSIDVLITHAHIDHFNGLAALMKKGIKVNTLYTGCNPYGDFCDEISKAKAIHPFEQILLAQGNFALHTYQDQTSENIFIYWPREGNITDWNSFCIANKIFPESLTNGCGEDLNYQSVMFSLVAADKKNYLFAGDLCDIISYTLGSNGPCRDLLSNKFIPEIGSETFDFIKMPHHGTSTYDWPIARGFLNPEGSVLISWGSGYKHNWGKCFQNASIQNIYATNVPSGYQNHPGIISGPVISIKTN